MTTRCNSVVSVIMSAPKLAVFRCQRRGIIHRLLGRWHQYHDGVTGEAMKWREEPQGSIEWEELV